MTVDPAETSELIWVLVGVGTGVGVGVGVGVGLGDGDGAVAANAAGAKAIDNAHARQSAATAASQRRDGVPLTCDGRIEQRMDAKFRNGDEPKSRQKCLFEHADLPSVPMEGQSRCSHHGGYCAPLCPCRHRSIRQGFAHQDDFSSRARSLLRDHFRVAIPVTIGIWPLDCAFREDSEIQQTTESPFVA
jgi:hypothetical protein